MIGSCHKRGWRQTLFLVGSLSIVPTITTLSIGVVQDWGIAFACASGMLGPVMAWSIDWVLTKRAYRRDPNRLAAFRIKAFASKMVFFGIYVTGVLSLLQLSVTPFVIGFTSSFIVVFIAEAFMLKRLFNNNIKVA